MLCITTISTFSQLCNMFNMFSQLCSMFSKFSQLCNMFNTFSQSVNHSQSASQFTFVTSLTADLLPDTFTNNHPLDMYTHKNPSTNTHLLDTFKTHIWPQLVARATSLTT